MDFFVNQKLKIIHEQGEYMCCVDAVSLNDISITIYDAVEIFIPGETLIIETTGSDAVYLCQATVLKAISGSRNTSCILSKPDNFSRVQRREFIRFPAHLALQFKEAGTDNWLKGQIRDISGNGLNMITHIQLPLDTILDLNFTIKIKTITHHMKTKGRVVREFNALSDHQYGILFVDLPANERDLVVKYILYESVKKRSLTSFLAGP
ncbi:MAG: PilZ domain-containing protein [Syntrophomonadaceae bacterium]